MQANIHRIKCFDIFTSVRRIFFLSLILLFNYSVVATDYSGVYGYSKGLNKASGTMYLSQINSDSAFFIIQSMSGMPDFFTLELKGFLHFAHDSATYQQHDSCQIRFEFKTSTCLVVETTTCHSDFSASGRYKKIHSAVKKGSSFLPGIIQRTGFIVNDSTRCFQAPHRAASGTLLLNKQQQVEIIDEYNGYYLIELKSKKNEFLWVPKKNISLPKKK